MSALTPVEQQFSIRPDGSRVAIHPADVKGRFITRRRVVFAALLALYLAAPLVKVNGHPAIHLDVAARRFYLLGSSFNAQDFWLALALVCALLFLVLFVTAAWGRIWCGWGCPQTVFLEAVFRPIERLVDGSREQRLRRSAEPWSATKIARTALKHGLYLLAALSLSQVALSLFLSASDLWRMIIDGPTAHPLPFAWSVGVTSALYFDFAWFREQLCVVACPYGRLQSAMQDKDSLIVGYDARRGDPRGKLRKSNAEDAPPLGDCIDCRRCVVVCPTGIDIRNGLQMECLGCMQCVDACDDVMEKVGRSAGLIRYDSLNGFAGEPRSFVRPRLVAYGTLFALAAGALILGLTLRMPFEANLLRAPGVPWVIDGGTVRNQFTLHLVNKHSAAADFELQAEAMPGAEIVLPMKQLHLGSLQDFQVPLFVTEPRAAFSQPFPVRVRVRDVTSGAARELSVAFLGPT